MVPGLMLQQHDACRGMACSGVVLAAGLAAILLFGPATAEAARQTRSAGHAAAPAWAPVSESILLDAETGQVLSESNADAITYPASLTKMMTLYLTFEALNAGRLRLDQYLAVSSEAAYQRPSKLGLTAGDSVQVQDLILGLVTKSANDAAAVLAEGLGGSVATFAERMNRKAQQLGMTNTFYRNASGLPDPDQRTTARDIARLALALYHDFPREYRYFSTREFEFRGATIGSHNHLLEWYEGADGIKTGFINASGFNLAASAVRNGHRLVGVIMGGRSAHSRDEQMAALLDQGFATVGSATMVARHDALPAAAAPLAASILAAILPRPVSIPAAAATQPAAAVAAPQPAPIPAAVVPQPASMPQPVSVPFVAETESAIEKPGLLSKALQHLSLVARAEASVVHDAVGTASRWSIQLGAFRAETAAERVARAAASLPIAKGKPLQIMQPDKSDREPLYRARLLNFTSKTAQEACAALHKKKIECSVVPPITMKVASR